MFGEILYQVIVPIIAAVVGGFASYYGIPFIKNELATKTYYEGTAEDIDLSHVRAVFHSAIFNYKLERVLLTVDGDKVQLSGSVETTYANKPSDKFHGEIRGTGKLVDGRAYIEYQGKYPILNEVWRGVAIINVPQVGPASGYWISFHTLAANGLYAFGEITLERKRKG